MALGARELVGNAGSWALSQPTEQHLHCHRPKGSALGVTVQQVLFQERDRARISVLPETATDTGGSVGVNGAG